MTDETSSKIHNFDPSQQTIELFACSGSLITTLRKYDNGYSWKNLQNTEKNYPKILQIYPIFYSKNDASGLDHYFSAVMKFLISFSLKYSQLFVFSGLISFYMISSSISTLWIFEEFQSVISLTF